METFQAGSQVLPCIINKVLLEVLKSPAVMLYNTYMEQIDCNGEEMTVSSLPIVMYLLHGKSSYESFSRNPNCIILNPGPHSYL